MKILVILFTIVFFISILFRFYQRFKRRRNRTFVYSRIGMALVSTQRVEFIVSEIVAHLMEFGHETYGITTSDFLNNGLKSKEIRKATLGALFNKLKLNPRLVVEEELNDYIELRNKFIHNLWKSYLIIDSENQTKEIIKFCYKFGQSSEKMESFFKGFLFFLYMRHVQNADCLPDNIKGMTTDFEFFMQTLEKNENNFD